MKCILDAKSFKRIIDNTKKFTSCNAKMMEYIHLIIDAEKQTIRAEALDGYRISIEYAKIFSTDSSFTCFIKPTIPRITKYDKYAELELDNKRLLVTVTDSITGYIQPEGNYYDVNRVVGDILQKEVVRTIGVNPQLLKDALDAVKNDGTYRSRPLAKIEIRNPSEPIVIRSGDKDIEENLKIVLPVNIRG